MTDVETDPETTGQDPASAAAPPSRRSALMRTGFIITVLVIVFFVIIPRYVDYEDVIEAFKGLTLAQFGLMTVLGIIAWFVSGQLFTALIPGLSPIRGNSAFLILSGIGSSVPFGPWNMGVVWVVLRGWGIAMQPATSGVALYGVLNQLARLAMPLIAVVALAIAGDLGAQSGPTFTIAIISIVAFFVTTGLIIGIVRSDRVADWLGRTGQRIVAWTLRRFGRTGGPNVSRAIHRFRDQLGEVIRRRGLLALAVSIVSQIVWSIVLVVALRACGVPGTVITPAEVLAVYALVMVITIIPLSPGGAGVPELLYIAGFSAIAGDQWESAITAGVFLFRLYNWFLPIPLAWILLKLSRRGRSMLPTTSEIKALASGAS
jgi:putative heme transporter